MNLICRKLNWLRHCALLFAMLMSSLVTEAVAQVNIQVSVWEVGLIVDQVDETGQEQFLIGLSRAIPLERILPQVTSDSKIDFASVTFGYREEGEGSSFRYQATVLDLLLQRAWWSGGVTILDIDHRGTAEHSATWAEVATGPGVHWQPNESGMHAAARAVAVIGVSAVEFGVPVDAVGRESGAHYGWLAMGSINVMENLEIRVEGGHSAWTSSDKREWSSAINVLFGFSERIALDAYAHWNDMSGTLGSFSRTRMGFNLTYRFLERR